MVLMVFILASSAAVSAKSFADSENHWAKYSIDFVTDEGYFVGTSGQTFSPNEKMTRGMFIAVLARVNGADLSYFNYSAFSDVRATDYYSSAVTWAYQNDIVAGTSKETFSPSQPVTREQICLILSNYLHHLNSGDVADERENKTFYDDYKISKWARDAVYEMQSYGYLVGDSNGCFRPTDNTTRAEAAVVFSRLSGQFFETYKVVQTETTVTTDKVPNLDKASKTLLGSYRLTCYCAGCNTPSGSRATACGALATAGEFGTVAVSSDLYASLGAGTVLYIEGVGYRTIQDKHGNTANVIDVYTGDGPCTCWTNAMSGKICNVYVVK